MRHSVLFVYRLKLGVTRLPKVISVQRSIENDALQQQCPFILSVYPTFTEY